MMTKIIALVGDFNEQILAHVANLKTIELVKRDLNADIGWQWLKTEKISGDEAQVFSEFSAFWVVPGCRRHRIRKTYENLSSI
jgi:CTP synthase (UTP-ammonia lyase)